ncbi:MAG TPA: 16S rRNA (guanine(966)-N(2))-methyltransferase RsmD [Acidimicrobiaceae bacterium]|nr:16S rRNA (guanine(966)-N(2))-methyltransferase RsmD [Acidimicrobiaceae bacterium]HAY64726.1 16S rRNA (guanine(966)-N(2))-methyltransferase RsmD [Acidimicrobiaceae bacterium]
MRVVGGNFRGRRIEAPNSQDVRPTSDRAREAIFNMLFSLGLPAGCSVADIFAGSGALGIEALSRGAASAVFIDSSREACVAIEKNLESLGAEAKIVRGDCLREMPSKNVDLVFADPPYGFEAWEQLLDCAADSIWVIESNRSIGPFTGWETVRSRRYGRAFITILRAPEENNS